jgi:hypothetical protein
MKYYSCLSSLSILKIKSNAGREQVCPSIVPLTFPFSPAEKQQCTQNLAITLAYPLSGCGRVFHRPTEPSQYEYGLLTLIVYPLLLIFEMIDNYDT